ncbi:hypothetical protein Vafri_12467 [Volvox africanus]|uniref:Uncharacterized protein n=1 Tax=Volvox africanus TaxID=51714 RepID=A0A8J4BER8_9CHLO|nr:hypothetical protein Vafri_12467 [Volvox africanus]
MRSGCACDGRPQIGTGAVLGLAPISTIEHAVNGRGIFQPRSVTIEYGWSLLYQYHTPGRRAVAARTDSKAWSSARRAAATSIAAAAAPLAPFPIFHSANSAVAASGPRLSPGSTRPPPSSLEATDTTKIRNAGSGSPSIQHHRSLSLRPAAGEDNGSYAGSRAAALILEGLAERRSLSDSPRHVPRRISTAGRAQQAARSGAHHKRADPSKQWAVATAWPGPHCGDGAAEARDCVIWPVPLGPQQQLTNHPNSHHANQGQQRQHLEDLVGFATLGKSARDIVAVNRVLTHVPHCENAGSRAPGLTAKGGNGAINGAGISYKCAEDCNHSGAGTDSDRGGAQGEAWGAERTGFQLAELPSPGTTLAVGIATAATVATAAAAAKGSEPSCMSKDRPYVNSSASLSHVAVRYFTHPGEVTGAAFSCGGRSDFNGSVRITTNGTGTSLACTTGVRGIRSRDRSVGSDCNHTGNVRNIHIGDHSGSSASGSCAGPNGARGAPAGADFISTGRACSARSAGRATQCDWKAGWARARGGSVAPAPAPAEYSSSPDQLSDLRTAAQTYMHTAGAPGAGGASSDQKMGKRRRSVGMSGAVWGHSPQALGFAPAPGIRAPGSAERPTAQRPSGLTPRLSLRRPTTGTETQNGGARQAAEPVPSSVPQAGEIAAFAGAGAGAGAVTAASAVFCRNVGGRGSGSDDDGLGGNGGRGRGERVVLLRQAAPGDFMSMPSLHGAALRTPVGALPAQVVHADAGIQTVAASLRRGVEACEWSHDTDVAGCQSRHRRVSRGAGRGGGESPAETDVGRGPTRGSVGLGCPSEAECSSGSAGGQRIPTRRFLGRWRELLSALRAAKSVAEVEHLVSLYGDGFGSEHVAAALEVLSDAVTLPCGSVEAVGSSARCDSVGTAATAASTVPAASAASSASSAEQRQYQAQPIVRRLLDISIRLLAQQRRLSATCLLALLVRPRQLGLVPEPEWVLPVLKKLITAAPSLEPGQLVVLLETLAAGNMWEYAPASGTVARRLALRMAQQLEVALPHLPVDLAARALGAVARLAPRGFGPFLEREAQRDAGGFAVQWAIRRAREAATGAVAGWYEIGGGLGNGHPAVVAWAGRYVDHSFSTTYMSYLRTALLRRAVGGEDVMRFLDAIVRFAEWPGVAGLRNLDHLMELERHGTTAAAAGNVAASTAASASVAVVRSSRGSAGRSTNTDMALYSTKPCYIRSQIHLAANTPQATALAPVGSEGLLSDSVTSAGAVSAGGDPSDCPPQPVCALSPLDSHMGSEKEVIRPLRRAVMLPRTAPPPVDGVAAAMATATAAVAAKAAVMAKAAGVGRFASSESQSSIPSSRRSELQPCNRVAQQQARPQRRPPPAPGRSTAEVSRHVVAADSHTAILMDLISLVPAPPTPSGSAREAPAATAAAATTASPHGQEPLCDLDLYCNALWALVRLGVRPSPPWVSALLAATQSHLPSMRPGTLARLWWALCVVRWAPAPVWRAAVMSAISGTAAALAPDQVCMILGGFGMWSCKPRRSWLDGLLAQVQPKLPAFHATSCTALAFACAKMGYRPRVAFLRPYLQQCSSQLPYMDSRNLVNLLWALHRLCLHHSLPAEWRARFLTACRGLMHLPDTQQPSSQQPSQRPEAVLASQVTGCTGSVFQVHRQYNIAGRNGDSGDATMLWRYGLRAGLVQGEGRPPAEHPPFTPSQLALLLLVVTKCGLAPGPLWRAEYWRACEAALPYMPPMALAAVLNGVWRLRISPPLRWTRAFFAASEAVLGSTSPSLLVQYAKLLLRTPMRPLGAWVRAYRSRLDSQLASMSRGQLDVCMRMIRTVSWRRRRTAPRGWLLRSARTQAEAAERWQRTQARLRRQRPLQLQPVTTERWQRRGRERKQAAMDGVPGAAGTGTGTGEGSEVYVRRVCATARGWGEVRMAASAEMRTAKL